MTNLYKVCSVIYRILLVLIIPVTFIAQFLVAVAGHNSDSSRSDYLVFTFIIITVALLTILSNVDREKRQVRSILRYASICFVSISLCVELYGLYDIFKNGEFSPGENIISLIVFLFTIISVIVLLGLIKGKI